MAEPMPMVHPSGLPGAKVSGEVAGNTGAVEMLAFYLKLAEHSMEAVQKMSDSLKFNNEQCAYLADKLKVVVETASSFLEVSGENLDRRLSSEDRTGLAEMLKFLVGLGKQAESFVEGCCRDAWIQAAMTLTNVSEYVSSLGFRLELCRLAFCMDHAASGLGLTLDEVGDISRSEAEVVERKAVVDERVLLEKVTSDLNSLRGESRDLASYLIQRLLRMKQNPTSDDGAILRKLFAFMEWGDHCQVGRGASATVYKVKWLGTWVAKKTFKGSQDEEFDKEVDILSRLCHPNITSMFCCTKSERNCSIIMELMDGDLEHLMERRCEGRSDCPPFSILEAIDIMLQIGEGVNYLHRKRIVHRDLKSRNILYKTVKAENLDSTGYLHVKVTDFGVSKSKDKSMTNSDLTLNVGTSRWMPPEIMRSSSGSQRSWFSRNAKAPNYPYKCDSYSFGMVCYEILSGQAPFPKYKNPNDIKTRVMKGERPCLPDDCPSKLKALIERCWAHEPKERPTFDVICEELKHLKYLLMTGYSLRGKPGLTRTEFEEAGGVAALRTLLEDPHPNRQRDSLIALHELSLRMEIPVGQLPFHTIFHFLDDKWSTEERNAAAGLLGLMVTHKAVNTEMFVSLAGSYACEQLVQEGVITQLLKILENHENSSFSTELALIALEKFLDVPEGRQVFVKEGGIQSIAAILKLDTFSSISAHALGSTGHAKWLSIIILTAVAQDARTREVACGLIFECRILLALKQIIVEGEESIIGRRAAVLMKLLAMYGPMEHVCSAMKSEGCLDALLSLRSVGQCEEMANDVLEYVSGKSEDCKRYIDDRLSQLHIS